jgi:uncharacterized repeat protein (TIGR03803 family)
VRYFKTRAAALALTFGAAALMPQGPAQAYTLTTLYSFCKKEVCHDGKEPESQPIMDASGNLFLTTDLGGEFNNGAVIELVKANKKKWKEKVIYSFNNQKDSGGAIPYAGLIMDVSGNLYGTTISGGAGSGTVYEVSRKAGKNGWTGKTLYAFCRDESPCPDGRSPQAKLTYAGAASGLPYDGGSPLYGTASTDGLQTIAGTVFQLVPAGGTWTETTIYQFCPSGNCTDGEEPLGSLTVDGAGNLLGTTQYGGFYSGTVFQLTPKSGKWHEHVLYDFCQTGQCPDGSAPRAEVLQDAGGNLFGTTLGGGATGPDCKTYFGVSDCGTVFELDSGGHESVLYSFCTQAKCADGAMPYAGLVRDNSGNLLGTTHSGGTGGAWESGRAGSGTIYAQQGTAHTVLYSFCNVSSDEVQCSDGASPDADVVVDSAGNIYGTTSAGGAYGMGTVFELSP